MNTSSKKPDRKPLEHYLQLDYPVTIHTEPDGGGFVAEVRDLPGCITQADGLVELWTLVADARHAWIQTAYEHGDPIPEPASAVSPAAVG